MRLWSPPGGPWSDQRALQDGFPGDERAIRCLAGTDLPGRGVARVEPRKKPRAAYRLFVYPAPNACWQLDATEHVLTGGRKCVIFQLQDDHSRLAIATHVAGGETSEAALCGQCGMPHCEALEHLAGSVFRRRAPESPRSASPTGCGPWSASTIAARTTAGCGITRSSTPGPPRTMCGRRRRGKQVSSSIGPCLTSSSRSMAWRPAPRSLIRPFLGSWPSITVTPRSGRGWCVLGALATTVATCDSARLKHICVIRVSY